MDGRSDCRRPFALEDLAGEVETAKARLGIPWSASLVNWDQILEALVNFGTFFPLIQEAA